VSVVLIVFLLEARDKNLSESTHYFFISNSTHYNLNKLSNQLENEASAVLQSDSEFHFLKINN
jgi:hypothetical protein